jgi:GntR family transcriptional regulator
MLDVTFANCTMSTSTVRGPIVALDIRILTGSTVPIYRQIVDQVAHAATTGVLKPDDQLPSVRELAERLVLNPNTVARAYGQLVREGVAEARQGRGVFVVERRQVYSDAERRRRLEAAVDRLVSEAVALNADPAAVRAALDRGLREIERAESRQSNTGGTQSPARRS